MKQAHVNKRYPDSFYACENKFLTASAVGVTFAPLQYIVLHCETSSRAKALLQ